MFMKKVSKVLFMVVLAISLNATVAHATPPAKQPTTWQKIVNWWNAFYPHMAGAYMGG